MDSRVRDGQRTALIAQALRCYPALLAWLAPGEAGATRAAQQLARASTAELRLLAAALTVMARAARDSG